MRTTITLDPDVEKMLKQTMRKSGKSFKYIVNSAVRAGLRAHPEKARRKPYRLKARDLGFRGEVLPSHVLESLDEDDGIRKLREGK
ncbi:MAG TPA: hypothetical protein VKX17_15685 [Planctomycetota bacterium]|nr:hypothetical protein [Planctomycetota bacterium]